MPRHHAGLHGQREEALSDGTLERGERSTPEIRAADGPAKEGVAREKQRGLAGCFHEEADRPWRVPRRGEHGCLPGPKDEAGAVGGGVGRGRKTARSRAPQEEARLNIQIVPEPLVVRMQPDLRVRARGHLARREAVIEMGVRVDEANGFGAKRRQLGQDPRCFISWIDDQGLAGLRTHED